jgi:hypothetical protein
MGFLKARAIAAYILGVAADEIIFLITAPRSPAPHPTTPLTTGGIAKESLNPENLPDEEQICGGIAQAVG